MDEMDDEPPAKRRKVVADSQPIVLSDSEDEMDEDLRRAIELSLQESTSSGTAAPNSHADAIPNPPKPAPEPEPPKPMSQLELVRMRQQQRYQHSLASKVSEPQKPLENPMPSAAKPALVASSALAAPDVELPHLNLAGKTVYLNRVSSKDPKGNIMPLEDIICKNMVESGIISGVFDEAVSELSYFLLERTRLVLCTMHTQPGVRLAAQTAPKTWSIAYSDNLVHAKFMILFFKKYCRIIIASGNFTQVEWTTIRQVFWYQDFPLRAPSSELKSTQFASTLLHFLTALNVPHKDWIEKLETIYDISSAVPHLIASIPSKPQNGPSAAPHESGLKHLQEFTRKIASSSNSKPKFLVAQTNTVSLASEAWLKELLAVCGVAASGDSSSLKIVYPTKEYFFRSGILGDAFSVILFRGNFPKNKFYTCSDVSFAGANRYTLLHSKVYYPDTMEWVYIGSHNLTKSAWGSARAAPSNFEIGIAFRPSEFESFTVPFQLPLEPYKASDELGGVVKDWNPQ